MAEWNNATPYAPGARVTYKGLNYYRSAFPPTSTFGTNPKEELSTDPKGGSIRTWELEIDSPKREGETFDTLYPYWVGYFSFKPIAYYLDGIYTKKPPMDEYPGKAAAVLWPGGTEEQTSAYGTVSSRGPIGVTVEMDQAEEDDPATPDMPAGSCGVAMQQRDALFTDPISIKSADAVTGVNVYINLIYDSALGRWVQDYGATPRVYYVFLLFNHPLYFRRTHTISFRISTYEYTGGYEIPSDNPEVPPVIVPSTFQGIYSTTSQVVTPTDNNYMVQIDDEFISPSNAVCTYTLPNDTTSAGPYGSTDGVNYSLEAVWVSDVEVND
jgi:hypothetical protein